MVKTAGRAPLPSDILQKGFGFDDGLGGADIEPQSLVNRPEAPTSLDRSVPEHVRRKWAVRRILQESLRDDLDSREDERGNVGLFAPPEAPRAVHSKIAEATMIVSSSMRHKQEEGIHARLIPM